MLIPPAPTIATMPTPPPSAQIRVALVEDDVEVQNAIVRAVEASVDLLMVSIASTRSEGLYALQGRAADVLLVDLGLPDGSGLDVIEAARHLWPSCAVMVCTTFADEAHVMKSLEAGASGYLLKDGEAGDMLREIRSLHAGGSPINPLIARKILTHFRTQPAVKAHEPMLRPDPMHSVLSARETEVLELITKGFTADEIAKVMQVSTHTVQTYVRRIYAKLKVNSKAEAIYEARYQGLV